MSSRIKVEDAEKNLADIFRRAIFGRGQKRYDIAIKNAEQILKRFPKLKTQRNLNDLGLVYDHAALFKINKVQKRRYEEKALKLYKKILYLDSNSIYVPYAVWGIGRVWWHRKNRKAIKYAIRAAELMKQITGKAGLMISNIGAVYEELGDLKEAETWYKKGVKESSKELGAYLNLVDFYYKTKNFSLVKKYIPKLYETYDLQTRNFKDTAWGKRVMRKIIKYEKSIKERRGARIELTDLPS